jgi:Tol biopolymer transport system component
MPFSAGTRLGPYEILAPIGAGGMGEVYRARDARLSRDVAVKVSQERFSDRFEREARAVAALNHPNICTLYDVGPDYLVMELIEGDSPKGPVPLEEALRIARQIANALDAAHEKGVIHRDLKPSNIKITPDGTVKVLDFGLAKIVELMSGDPESSPTVTASPTRAGMILGTAAYMSPEQARGKTVDKRADIWAFGVVLYELLTGRRPFRGEDLTDTLASVMKDKPDLSGVAPRVRSLLERCLEKDPKKRLRDIGDAWIVIDAALAGETPTVEGGTRRPWLGWSVAAVLAAGLAAVMFLYVREKPAVPAASIRFQIPAPDNAALDALLNLSPDGRKLAFIAGDRLWVHFLESGESRNLTVSGGTPFWSPDSRFIAYPFAGKINKIEVSGGPPETVTVSCCRWGGGAWSQDNLIIFSIQAGLFRVPASGGTPVQITAVDPSRQETSHHSPSFLPDGRHFVYSRRSRIEGKSAIYLGSVDAKPEQQISTPLMSSFWGPKYASSPDPRAGYLLFVREDTLMAQPLDNRRFELIGHAAPLAEDMSDGRAFSVSDNGALVYHRSASDRQLTWYDRDGHVTGAAGVPGNFHGLTLSPDGTRLAAMKLRAADASSLWLLDLSRGGAGTRFTFGSSDSDPLWSPDGGRIVFSSNRIGHYDLYQKPANGSTDEVVLLASAEDKNGTSWSRDGRFLLYTVFRQETKNDIWVFPLEAGKKPFPFLATEYNEVDASFSPDGRWVAYTSYESGGAEVYVRSFSMNKAGTAVEAGGKWLISNGGGSGPRWRSDGRELYYLSLNNRVMAVGIATTPAFRQEKPQALGLVVDGDWDFSADGKHFLAPALKNSKPEPFTVVLNWQAGLKK